MSSITLNCKFCNKLFSSKPSAKRVFCSKKCYGASLTTDDLLMARFLGYVDKTSSSKGCWLWIGNLTTGGYGHYLVKKKFVYSHRQSYEYFVGPIPEGLVIDHLCRNPPCCNPAHLEAVTQKENMARTRGTKLKTHCKNGHEYNQDNTRYYLSRRGLSYRYCITCDKERGRIRRGKDKARPK